MGPEPETGKTAGRRKAGRPRADHQGFLLHPDGESFESSPVLKQGELHVELVCGSSRGAFGVLPVNPGTAFPKVHRAHRPDIDPLFGEAELHELHFPVRRAGADEDLADPALADQGLCSGCIARQAE